MDESFYDDDDAFLFGSSDALTYETNPQYLLASLPLDHMDDYFSSDHADDLQSLPMERTGTYFSEQSHEDIPFSGNSTTFANNPAAGHKAPNRYASSEMDQNFGHSPYQPLLLSKTPQSGFRQDWQGSPFEAEHNFKPKPRNTFGIRLRPVSELPDIYRTIFKFGVFNAVQSTCFNEIMTSKSNLVISAPTGAGKTALFELSVIRMLEDNKKTGHSFKCVYVAPTKALCSERFQDWAAKLEPIGLQCCELTGDTVTFGKSAWANAKSSAIIVTTCEKWDSLTRNWYEHENILSQIQLFLVDEVHILNESRGSTLEVIISRMKLRGSSVRFILLSATVPNIHDVARWIESGPNLTSPAQVFEFGEEYRPCQLTRHVVGVPRRQGCNDFQFAKALDAILFSNLQQFSVGKPILIFCATRKGVFGTADRLLKDFTETESKRAKLPWCRPARINPSFSDKRLEEFACAGIGVHHAGLVMEDRKTTEQLYMNGTLRILIATSTLAVGVNLPAQMVVIKGTHVFQNNASKEYSDLDIMQMLGRAGRPQFDKEGIAVIMCESSLVQKYKLLAQGTTILESSLHINLDEHLNSEIGLKTIGNVDEAKIWLRKSFLYQRMQNNPKYYSVDATANGSKRSYQDIADAIVMTSIARLQRSQLIEHVQSGSEQGKLVATNFGEIMSKMYIRRSTMELILAVPKQASIREILENLCAAEEFQDIKLRASEKSIFNGLRKDPDIRYEVRKVETTIHKVFLLVQAILAGINLHEYKTSESQPQLEAYFVFKHISRIARAVLQVSIAKEDGTMIMHSLELLRCLSAKAWEDRAIVLRQIEQLGEKSIKILAEHGINSFDTLRKQTPQRIEVLLNRRPPFGLDVLASVADIPQYSLTVQETGIQSDGGESPVQIDLLVECGLVSIQKHSEPSATKTRKSQSRSFQTTTVLTLTSDLDLIDLRQIPTKALSSTRSFEITAELKKPSQSIIVLITSENVAGVTLQRTYRPTVAPEEYPVLDTRPATSVDMDLIGLEDDPDFWNMTLDSSSNVEPALLEMVKMEDHLQKSTTQTTRNVKSSKSNYHKRHTSEVKITETRYECNHPCKDKTKCRHLCCREGLRGPSASKGKIAAPYEPTAKCVKPASSVQRLHETTNTSSENKKNDILTNLDSLHEQTHVAENLKLAEGKRLRLMNPVAPKRRIRTPPSEYNVSFTQLSDDRIEQNALLHLSDRSSDSDELPDVILPLPKNSENKADTKTHKPLTQKDYDTEHQSKRRKHRHVDTQITAPVEKMEEKLFYQVSEDDFDFVEILSSPKSAGDNGELPEEIQFQTAPKAEQIAPFGTDKSRLPSHPALSIEDSTGQGANPGRAVHEYEDVAGNVLEDLISWLETDSVEIL